MQIIPLSCGEPAPCALHLIFMHCTEFGRIKSGALAETWLRQEERLSGARQEGLEL